MKKKNHLYIFIIACLLILIGICSFFIFYFYQTSQEHGLIKRLTYSEKYGLDYVVHLKDNKYYDSQTTYNEAFVTKLISTIRNDFSYSISFNDYVKGEYNYYVVGYLLANTTKDNAQVLKKEVTKSSVYRYAVNGSVINLNNSFIIDANDIIQTYESFKKDYTNNISGSISYDVIITYNVYNAKIDKYCNDVITLNITIPISEETTKISVTPKIIKQDKYYSDLSDNDRKLYIAICCEFGGAILLFVIIIMLLAKKIINNTTTYSRQLNKIMRLYDEYLVNVREIPSMKDIQPTFIVNIKDLVDVAKQLNKTISYKEVIPHHECIFIIIDKKLAYIYKLTSK